MSNTNTEDFTHACACVVKFWVWIDVSIKSEFEGMNGRGCFVSSGMLTSVSSMERKNHSISLCER